MTLEQFLKTKKYSPDLGQDLTYAELCGVAGFIYCDALYIEIVPEDVQAKENCEKYLLTIGRDSWTDCILRELEKQLLEFAIGEGYNAV